MLGRTKPRILCVSRSFFQLKAMRDILPERDYEVFVASTPEQAVAICANNHLAAVVMDSEFASIGGWSVAQTFRIVNAHLPILLLAKGHNGDIPTGVDTVADSYSEILGKLKILVNPRS